MKPKPTRLKASIKCEDCGFGTVITIPLEVMDGRQLPYFCWGCDELNTITYDARAIAEEYGIPMPKQHSSGGYHENREPMMIQPPEWFSYI